MTRNTKCNGSKPSVAPLCIGPETPLLEVLRIHAGAKEHGLPVGIALVTDKRGRVTGTLTDGDVRRAILRHGGLGCTAGQAMTTDPIVFPEGIALREVLERLPAELERRGRSSHLFLGKIVMVDEDRRPTRVIDYHQLWEQRVATHRHIVVVGLGYVGLTLGLIMADSGYNVTGVDTDTTLVTALQNGQSYIHEIGLPEMLREYQGRNFRSRTDMPEAADVFIVAVGTPVKPSTEGKLPTPDLTSLRRSCEMIAPLLRRGGLVVLRSTVPVGTTRNVVLPMLQELTGMRGGSDFHLAFAPERTVEGRAQSELRALPQVIGGLNEDSAEAAVALFREITPTIVRVASLETAEMVKLINNSFRDLIFSFSNEVAQLSARYGVDAVEAIKAANQGYPRDPVPLPSPGVGGPCLTKDPYIFAAAAKGAPITQTLMEHGRRINEAMPGFVVDAVLNQIKKLGKDPARCDVLVCGLAFKGRPETGDCRSSPGVEIARMLRGKVGRVFGHDPVVAPATIQDEGLIPETLPGGFAGKDAVLVLNNHPSYEKTDVFSLARALRAPGILFDGWHMFREEDVLSSCPCVYMALGYCVSSVGS
ncbi:MAG: nucleotide sugar dehydrogenase [Deltaproteobacteria bacterium]|nr:nucleotide sugar dehydrogenase [Deltaproteobacteria bacterium]